MENLPTFKFRDRKPGESPEQFMGEFARNVDESWNDIRKRVNWLLERVHITTETAGALDRDGNRSTVFELIAPGERKNTNGNFRVRLVPDGANFQYVFEVRKSGIWTAVKAIDNDGNWIIEKTAGLGIKVDLTTPTFGWRDWLGDLVTRNTGASKPTHAAYKGGCKDYQFAAGDEEYFRFHVPHDHVPGTDIFVHFHWSHIGTLVTGGNVVFDYEATYAKGHNQSPFGTNAVGTVTGTASIVQHQKIISEGQFSAASPSAAQIDTDNLEPDGVILMTAGLNANNITVSGGAVPDPFIHYVDIHAQSTGVMGTKQKAPDFYV